jgi:hypothetical protein
VPRYCLVRSSIGAAASTLWSRPPEIWHSCHDLFLTLIVGSQRLFLSRNRSSFRQYPPGKSIEKSLHFCPLSRLVRLQSRVSSSPPCTSEPQSIWDKQLPNSETQTKSVSIAYTFSLSVLHPLLGSAFAILPGCDFFATSALALIFCLAN